MSHDYEADEFEEDPTTSVSSPAPTSRNNTSTSASFAAMTLSSTAQSSRAGDASVNRVAAPPTTATANPPVTATADARPSWLSGVNTSQQSNRNNDWLSGGSSAHRSLGQPLHLAASDTNKASQQQQQQLQLQQQHIQQQQQMMEIVKGLTASNLDSYICPSVLRVSNNDVTLHGDSFAGGGFALVYRGTWMRTPVAVKRIFDPKMTEELLGEFRNEVNMLARLRHPNIISLLGCSPHPPLLIITELMPRGSMYSVLYESKHALSNDLKMDMLVQCAKALYYLHTVGVVHGDVKPANFLLDEHFRVKLCDFGTARSAARVAADAESKNLSGAPGTLAYIPPETFASASSSSASSSSSKASEDAMALAKAGDVYAFGVMLNEVFLREIPWEGYDQATVKAQVLAGQRPESTSPSLVLPTGLRPLVTACWAAAPTARPPMAQVLDSLLALQQSFTGGKR